MAPARQRRGAAAMAPGATAVTVPAAQTTRVAKAILEIAHAATLTRGQAQAGSGSEGAVAIVKDIAHNPLCMQAVRTTYMHLGEKIAGASVLC